MKSLRKRVKGSIEEVVLSWADEHTLDDVNPEYLDELVEILQRLIVNTLIKPMEDDK